MPTFTVEVVDERDRPQRREFTAESAEGAARQARSMGLTITRILGVGANGEQPTAPAAQPDTQTRLLTELCALRVDVAALRAGVRSPLLAVVMGILIAAAIIGLFRLFVAALMQA